MFWRRNRESPVARHSVREDWCARLPEDKNLIFDGIVHEWEGAYAVFSIPLDDAIAFHADGKLTRARQCVDIASTFVADLTVPVSSSCRTMERWGHDLAMPPAVSALNPSFYRTDAARQNAHWNQLMHLVLFGARSRFLHKLQTLGTSTITLGAEFHREAEDLSSGLSLRPDSSWSRLDELHYDLNTCLRETVVVLKSFLLALPARSVVMFQRELSEAAASSRESIRYSTPRVPR